MGDMRNMIIAAVLAVGIILGYQFLVLDPMMERRQAEQAAMAERETGADLGAPGAEAPTTDAAPSLTADAVAGTAVVPREEALARSPRIEISTPALHGSINLAGARLDDLELLRYDIAVGSEEPVTLFSPEGAEGAYYAVAGWAGGAGAPANLPGPDAVWTQVGTGTLTPDSPVVLEYRAGDLVFRRTIRVDEDYLFTVTDDVTNEGAAEMALARYGFVRRHGLPGDLDRNGFILQQGPAGVVGDRYIDRKYNKIAEDRLVQQEGEGGWMGISDKYWLAAIAPEGDPMVRAEFRARGTGDQLRYEANYIRNPERIAPGQTLTSTSYVYAGSKNFDLIRQYQDEYGIERFDMAIDWGMFWFLTRPFFWILETLTGLFGNFGLAIMALVVGLKIVLFPLNNRAFASMAKMRAVTPKMQEIRERFAADKQRQQQEMMELYKREKINPVAGCLPILPQIPIFFALYKTVFISLEARHANFLWIKDMSAPDPTTMWNLFGLLPYDPTAWGVDAIPLIGGVIHAILIVGAFPILMGLTMWAQQSLNPPPPDPMQRRIFAFLPIVFTIVLAPFAAALVIYWTWNNFLTIVQQYFIMRRHGTEPELEKQARRAIARLRGEKVPAELKSPDTMGSTATEKAAAATKQVLDAGPENAGGAGSETKDLNAPLDAEIKPADEGGEPAPRPASASGGRTRSNPAAKKRRSPARKKPGGKS